MKRTPLGEIISLNAYWVGLSFMWNSLHALVLPVVLLNMIPETQKNTYLGILTFVGLLVATVVQPVSGAISDRWTSRWGRRRPLILMGTVFDFIFLAIVGWAGGLVWLAIGYIGLQISSNTAHGPLQGLLPDRVPQEQLGVASGFKNLFDMGGLVIALLLVGRILPPDSRQPIAAVGLMALVLLVGAVITLGWVREPPAISSPLGTAPASTASLFDSLRVNVRAHPAFWRLVASRAIYLLGIYGIQAFALYYVRDVLKAANPAQLTGDLLASLTIALMAFAVVGGWLSDRVGHKRLLVVGHLLSAVGCVLLLFARTPGTLLAFGSVLGAGIGLFITANWALANLLAPAAEVGKYMGLTNLATAGSGALGRLEGPLIDALNNAYPGVFAGYLMLFILGAVCAVVSVAVLANRDGHEQAAFRSLP
ncbi:MAG: MFS transporter [Chloroflexi bacterium]|nr:MFS transporter [Chloroflexota bacterium]